MDYDSYGSNAVELAIDLANADRQDPAWAAEFVRSHDEWFTTPRPAELSAADSPAGCGVVNHSSWLRTNSAAQAGSERSALARSMASSTAFDP